MAHWTEIDGSPVWSDGPGSTQRLTRNFQTDVNQGNAQAAANGYIRGNAIVYNGFTLYCVSINVRNTNGADQVEVVYEAYPPDQDDHRYNQGVRRYVGEEEWNIEAACSTEECSAETKDFKIGSNFAGWSAGTTWKAKTETHPGDSILSPGMTLVCRRWLQPLPQIGANNHHFRRCLPKSENAALIAAYTYMPPSIAQNSGTIYESNPPQLGKRLSPTGNGAYFVCIDVALEQDGDLICRIARFQFNRNGWASPPYA